MYVLLFLDISVAMISFFLRTCECLERARWCRCVDLCCNSMCYWTASPSAGGGIALYHPVTFLLKIRPSPWPSHEGRGGGGRVVWPSWGMGAVGVVEVTVAGWMGVTHHTCLRRENQYCNDVQWKLYAWFICVALPWPRPRVCVCVHQLPTTCREGRVSGVPTSTCNHHMIYGTFIISFIAK